MTTAALFAITVYAGVYVGQPLYCDTWDTELVYSAEMPPWVAMPDAFWDNGGQCWDKVGVMIDGETLARRPYLEVLAHPGAEAGLGWRVLHRDRDQGHFFILYEVAGPGVESEKEAM